MSAILTPTELKSMRIALICCALALASSATLAREGSDSKNAMNVTDLKLATSRPLAPAEVATALPQASLLGRGTLRFFGLAVYEARLWVTPDFMADRYAAHPFALELEYARKLDGPAIAERSIAEMRRVGQFDEERGRAWLAFMIRAFPNVQAKDRLVGVHDGVGGVRFLHNGRETAAITDRDFARLFFGIWLDAQSSAPALRQALLGIGTRG